MANETVLTIVGNTTADVDLRYTQSGIAVANFTVASTPREWDRQANAMKDGDPLFMRCTAWRELAEHVSQSIIKGTRVVVQGRLVQRSYETQQGEKRTTMELQVDEIGPSLRWATAQVTRTTGGGAGRSSGAPQGQQGGGFGQPQQGEPWGAPQQAAQPQGDLYGDGAVWGAPGAGSDSETPF